MNDPQRNELMQIYKLHAELADRVSQRREDANRLYVSLLMGLAILLGVFVGFRSGEFTMHIVLQPGGVIGIILSASWFVVIRSYRQLNSGKIATLLELEEKLSFAFFKREWELLGEGKKTSRYWKLTVVETFLPIAFFLFFAVVLIFPYL